MLHLLLAVIYVSFISLSLPDAASVRFDCQSHHGIAVPILSAGDLNPNDIHA